jgi:Fe-S cluster assembly ATP-binding protein
MLEIKDLVVAVEGKEILHGINMTIRAGETHVLFGPNGSGKTTLLMTIMGFPKYQVKAGTIFLRGVDITRMPVDERARMGIGMSFQRPPVVRGVKTRDMVLASMKDKSNPDLLTSLASRTDLLDFLDRDINYGFSGGEIKRSELMQLLAQRPDLVLLDEPESGVDLENIVLIGRLINELLEKESTMRTRSSMGLIITHTGFILDYVNARNGYIMLDGKIGCMGDPHEILKEIKEKGYEECAKCILGSTPNVC